MGGSSIQLDGIEELSRKLGVAVDLVVAAAKSSVYGQAVALAELANRKGMVPVASGQLMNSLYITEPQRQGDRVVVELGYGANYAAEVHQKEFRTVSQGGHYLATRGTPGWLNKAAQIHARALAIRLQTGIARALATGQFVTPLASGIPTSPPSDVVVSKFRRKYGFSRETAKAMRALKKSGALQLVRRWKRPKKKGR